MGAEIEICIGIVNGLRAGGTQGVGLWAAGASVGFVGRTEQAEGGDAGGGRYMHEPGVITNEELAGLHDGGRSKEIRVND